MQNVETIYEQQYVKLSVKQVLGWCLGILFMFGGITFTAGKYASDFEGLKRDVAALTIVLERQNENIQNMSRQLAQLSEEIKNKK
jgi:hypothetical protein